MVGKEDTPSKDTSFGRTVESAVSKVLYMCAAPSLSPRIRVKIWVLWWVLVIPALGTRRQENLQGSGASLHDQIGKIQARERLSQ